MTGLMLVSTPTLNQANGNMVNNKSIKTHMVKEAFLVG